MVDPVMVSTSGDLLAPPATLNAIRYKHHFSIVLHIRAQSIDFQFLFQVI